MTARFSTLDMQRSMEVKTLGSIREIGAGEWNGIVGPNGLIRRHEFLSAVEASDINDCRYFYPTVRQDGKLAAHTCLYFISTELDTFAKGAGKKIIVGIRKAWKDFMILRSVECGCPVALGNAISFAPDADRKTALGLIAREAERIAGGLGVKTLLFRDYGEKELAFYDMLAESGYRRIRNLPSCEMEVRWDSFDAYMRALRSEYRNKASARMKRFAAAGGRMERIADISPLAEDTAVLWRNVYDRATEYRREILKADFFRNMGSLSGGGTSGTSAIFARIKGKPAGFMLLFIDDDTLTPIFCGLDYEVARESCLYFNLFYETIRIAIEMKMRDIDLGITTLVPKLELGGVVKPLYMYMKHTNRLANGIVPNLFDLMTPRPPSLHRSVFKS